MRAITLFLLPAAVLVLAGCAATPPPPAAPDFAARPYEPLSRAAAIETALAEWRAFGGYRVGDPPGITKPERREGLWQKVGLYWWLGLEGKRPERAWTGRHDESGSIFPESHDGTHPWSAAFISYVMRMAGAGRGFPYAPSHAEYIDAARHGGRGWAIAAEDPGRYAPVAGDLICFHRERAEIRFADLPLARHFAAHCEIVTAVLPDRLESIGGNVADAVALRSVPIRMDGRIADPDGRPLDPANPWLAVLRVTYAR